MEAEVIKIFATFFECAKSYRGVDFFFIWRALYMNICEQLFHTFFFHSSSSSSSFGIFSNTLGGGNSFTLLFMHVHTHATFMIFCYSMGWILKGFLIKGLKLFLSQLCIYVVCNILARWLLMLCWKKKSCKKRKKKEMKSEKYFLSLVRSSNKWFRDYTHTHTLIHVCRIMSFSIHRNVRM